MSVPASDSDESPDAPGRTAKADRTRDAVYRTALAEIEEQGFENATIRAICAKAGVSPATFYTYFPQKNDVLREAVRNGEIFLDEYRGLSANVSAIPPLERIRVIASDYASMNVRNGLEMLETMLDLSNGNKFDEHPQLDALQGAVEDAKAEGCIGADTDAEALVTAIIACLRGVAYTWCLENGAFDLQECTIRQIDLLLEGVRRVAQ